MHWVLTGCSSTYPGDGTTCPRPVVCEQETFAVNALKSPCSRSSTCPSTSTTASTTDIQSFGEETISHLCSTQHIRRETNTIQKVDEAKPSSSCMNDMRAPVLSPPLWNRPGELISPSFVPTNQHYVLPDFSGYIGQYSNVPFSEIKPVVCEQQEIAVNALLSLKSPGSSSSSTPTTTSSASVQTSGDETTPEFLSGLRIRSKPYKKSYNKSQNNICQICGKGYARPSTLKTHLRMHSGEKPYRCDVCGKAFTQAANLTAHMRTHSGEKPFSCPICQKRFSQSSSVTTHLRTHAGERLYRCDYCGKAFADTSTLTKHREIHSREKPYRCKICNLGFSQSGNLWRHMKTHNNNELPANALKSAGSSSSTCPSTSNTTAASVQRSEDDTTPELLTTQHKRAAAASTLDDSIQKFQIAKTSRSYMEMRSHPPFCIFGPPQDFKRDESGDTLLKHSLASKTTATEQPNSMSNFMRSPPPPIFSLSKNFNTPEQHISPSTSHIFPELLSHADQYNNASISETNKVHCPS